MTGRVRRNVDVITSISVADEPDNHGTFAWTVRGRCGCNAHNGIIDGQSLAWGYAPTHAEALATAEAWQPNTWPDT